MADCTSIEIGRLPAGSKVVFKEGLSYVAIEPNGALKLVTPLGIMPLQLEALSSEAQAAVAKEKQS